MKKVLILFISLLSVIFSQAQDSVSIVSQSISSYSSVTQTKEESSRYPYKTSFKRDAPVIAIGVGLTYLGNTLIKNKDPLTLAELATKTRDKIPSFDRGNAGFYDEDIDRASYIPFLGSFAVPLVMLLNKNEGRNASHILVMYLESLSITSALFTMAAGTLDRPRPLVYGTNAPTDERINKNNQRSFYAGHTAATASATFFAAKVFQDLNPDSKAKPYVWIAAAAVPALVGYMRYESGFHFLSDNLLGYVLGAASGILIPEWHKSKGHKNLSFTPQIGKDYKGLAFVYNIK
ncbi:MAG TPA: phosphatase PAP2 family protein [Chitinophagaceae bacterium]|nr:phosphatase PAP2 family protein [Chitinophagaceae bacterium]